MTFLVCKVLNIHSDQEFIMKFLWELSRTTGIPLVKQLLNRFPGRTKYPGYFYWTSLYFLQREEDHFMFNQWFIMSHKKWIRFSGKWIILQHYLLLLPQAKFHAAYGIHWCVYCRVWLSHVSNILRGLDSSLPNTINLTETIAANANRINFLKETTSRSRNSILQIGNCLT